MISPTTRGDTLVYFAKLLVANINLFAAKSNNIKPSTKLIIKLKMLFFLYKFLYSLIHIFMVKIFVQRFLYFPLQY
jgi:hypothetical protein